MNKLVKILYFELAPALVLMISCATFPSATPRQEMQMRLYPHTVNSDGRVVYHALCEIYERSPGNATRSSSFNNAVIKINGYDLHLDEGFVEIHRGENYEDYAVDGRFLYIGDELSLDSGEEVCVQMIHPAIGRIERDLKVPLSIRDVRVDGSRLALWLAGDIATLGVQWTGEKADRYQVVVLASLHDGQTERTYLDTDLQEAHIERSRLNLPTSFDLSAHRLEIEVIAWDILEFDVERVHCVWRIESPFARRLALN